MQHSVSANNLHINQMGRKMEQSHTIRLDPYEVAYLGVLMIVFSGKNVRRNNCEEGVEEYPRSKKVCWKSKKEMVI